MKNKPIGGYFELELAEEKAHLYPEALKFQSSRASFYALLKSGMPDRVWVPRYICDSMLLPIQALSIPIQFYDLTEDLKVNESVVLKEGDWIVYVNYFGVCAKQENDLLKRFNPAQVIFDHSQAFFAPPLKCLATIYSPRKFFGVPDGGYLMTNIAINEPVEADSQVQSRCEHLLLRLDSHIQQGYKAFNKSEESFNDVQPYKMAKLTTRLLTSIDYKTIKNKRNHNFLWLHERLRHLNLFKLNVPLVDGPLCYPLLIENSEIKMQLLKKRIFIATYWKEVQKRVEVNSKEYFFVENMLPIPCDQRYNEKDMSFIVDSILKIINQK